MNDFERRMKNSSRRRANSSRNRVVNSSTYRKKAKYSDTISTDFMSKIGVFVSTLGDSVADFLTEIKGNKSSSKNESKKHKPGGNHRKNNQNCDEISYIRKSKPDYMLLVYVSILVMIGLIVIFAIGPQKAYVMNVLEGTTISDTHFVIRQSMYVLAAVFAFFMTAYIIPFRYIYKLKWYIFLMALFTCFILFVLGNILHVSSITQCALGACRWFKLPGIGTFQPAEFLKFGVLVAMSGFLGMRMKQGLINDTSATLIPVGIIMAICAIFVIVAQKDLGSGVALIAIIATMIFGAGLSKRNTTIAVGVLLAASALLIISAPHRVARVLTFMQGDDTSMSDPSAYHSLHAKIAIGSGGLTGVGIGNSVQAAGYLPEAINDSVFAIMGETFGYLGLLVILGIYLFLLLRLLSIFDHLIEPVFKMILIGVFGWIGSHVIINVSSMIGLIPLTGITLPFLSFGGTSILFVSLAIGLAYQVSQYTVHSLNIKEKSNENSRGRRGVGRTRYASRRSS